MLSGSQLYGKLNVHVVGLPKQTSSCCEKKAYYDITGRCQGRIQDCERGGHKCGSAMEVGMESVYYANFRCGDHANKLSIYKNASGFQE